MYNEQFFCLSIQNEFELMGMANARPTGLPPKKKSKNLLSGTGQAGICIYSVPRISGSFIEA